MKRDYLFCNLVAGFIVGILLGLMVFAVDYIDTHYTREECEIVNIKDNTIWAVDKTDNLWMFDVEKNIFKVGDIIDLQMHTNHTDSNIFDDVILKIEN